MSLKTPSTFALGTEPLTYVGFDEAARLYAAFREGGQTTFDTAHCYTYWNHRVGSAEARLGELVRRLEADREQVYIITKGGHVPVPGRYDVPDRYLAPEVLQRQLDESLSRLDLGPIDLYLLHRDDPRVPADEHLSAVQPFLAAGHVRRIGVSNWAPARIEAANAAAARNGWTPFTVCEAMHNLAHLPPERSDPLYPKVTPTDLDWYAMHRFPMLAFSSTAQGFFATRRGFWLDNPESRLRCDRAESLARELSATPTQIALAYLLHSPFPCIPIFATQSVHQIAENLASKHLRLTPDMRQFLVNATAGR